MDEVVAREDETVLVEGERAGEPVGMRSRSDEDEQRVSRHDGRRAVGAVAQHEVFELSAAAGVDDLRPEANGDVRGGVDLVKVADALRAGVGLRSRAGQPAVPRALRGQGGDLDLGRGG